MTFVFMLASSKSASAAGVWLQPFQLIFQSLSLDPIFTFCKADFDALGNLISL